MDTIFAQGTAKGKAGVSIIRVSGEKSLSIAKNFTNHIDFEPNRMYLSELRSNGVKIDSAMVVYFKAPCSFTGEDVVEFHLHGSIAVVRKMSEVLLSLGIRIAEPGEFSKRAFLNGKMDLTAAEGLADLIDAETEIQHRQAIMHMGGEFEVLCGKWREMLLKSQSLVEAYIDFPDEEIPESVLKTTNDLINDLKQSLNEKLDDKRRGERLRSGISMVV
ncbi:MAG: tRNA modification GTPase TrmE, partial [Pseudomonadota bacterium]